MTLHADYDPENIFAKIIAGEMPAARVHDSKDVLVIMDAFPQSRGHCLVIPKRPVRNMLQLAPKDIGRLFGTVQRVSQAVDKAFSPAGIRIAQFNGEAAGQTVYHLHVHIIPCYEGETLNAHAGGMIEKAELDKLATLIAKELA